MVCRTRNTRSIFPTNIPLAQSDIKDSGASPSADDFLAREKALLGEDANQFATSEDAVAFGTGDDDLLGGGGSSNLIAEESTFESQFPDLANQNEVRYSHLVYVGPT